jgi:hypothetical protein
MEGLMIGDIYLLIFFCSISSGSIMTLIVWVLTKGIKLNGLMWLVWLLLVIFSAFLMYLVLTGRL